MSRRPPWRKPRIPFVQQLEAADCGAACLSMVLGYFGRPEPSSVVRKALGVSAVGVNLHTILASASRFGLSGRALRLRSADYANLPRGAIIHWDFNHVVVFDEPCPAGVRVVDPGAGRRVVPIEEFLRKFTGLALVFDKADTFAKVPRDRSAAQRYFSRIAEFRPILYRILIASFAISLLGVVLPALTGVLIGRVIAFDDRGLLLVVGAVGTGAIVFSTLTFYVRSIVFIHLRNSIDLKISTAFVAHLMSLPASFFQRRTVGDLMLRVHSNTSIRELLSASAISAVLDGTIVVLYLVVALIISPPICLALVVIGACQAFALLVYRRRMTEEATAELFARSRTHSELVQVLTGIQTLKAVGAEVEALRMWSDRFADETNAINVREYTQSGANALFYAVEIAAPFAVIWIGSSLVISGSLELGLMLGLAALSAAFFRPLAELVRNGTALFEVRSHLERIDDIIATPPEEGLDSSTPVNLRGAISLERITFRYEGQRVDTLEDVTLAFPAGRMTAIVGPSGCGKSTLVSLSLGLHRPCEGTVRFDGIDLRSLPARQVRRSIGVVPQNPFLFEGSVRNNIALTHPEASLDDIVAAARIACIDDDIQGMFNGYDTRLSANGESVSGGQRQRIAIARAVLGRPRVLFLDEATSALDAVTESRIVEKLKHLDCTRVVIAHRLSTVVSADRIVVLAEGGVVDAGTHDELRGRCATYQELLGAQLQVE